ncbi:PE domain-containing protein [Candidatus Mycobacterium wuenschmannii]|uniref:PE domain-containing protein n=1 Tax=Candidatus Mycobacterium wuenschmannii TaxID=3027808 RepID=A0ABY8W6J7_9MYCO|nr:PE domain-containing protein [Candidatus Mycobacterium wuenschmannii]WIM90082.1 PE domain-containing protein [Candidatus Mycobacterium wuenschmannii]
MAFVNTQPAAISAAATQLEAIFSSFAAESAGAAASTTDVLPAAADEVSILQAAAFSTYGTLYQSVSEQAQAIQQQFNQLLGQTSGSYQETESANQAGAAANALSNGAGNATSAAAQPADAFDDLVNGINSFNSFMLNDPLVGFLSSNIANLANINVGNYASAMSVFISLGGGGLLTALAGPATAGADIGGLGTALAGDVAPAAGIAGAGGIGSAPVLAGAGAGSSVGALSVPPGWAGGAGIPAAGGAPVTLASQTFGTGAPATAGGTNGIAGMPAVANGGRGGSSFGAPRYGVKPKVMPLVPKPTVT